MCLQRNNSAKSGVCEIRSTFQSVLGWREECLAGISRRGRCASQCFHTCTFGLHALKRKEKDEAAENLILVANLDWAWPRDPPSGLSMRRSEIEGPPGAQCYVVGAPVER